MALQVELVSPERIVYSGEAEAVIARTISGGDIAFLEGHAPFVGALEIATATITTGGGEQQVAVHGGFVEVTTEAVGDPLSGGSGVTSGDSGPAATRTVVTILSDVAELASDIDVSRAQKAKERALERLRNEVSAEAEAELRRAHVRLTAAGV